MSALPSQVDCIIVVSYSPKEKKKKLEIAVVYVIVGYQLIDYPLDTKLAETFVHVASCCSSTILGEIFEYWNFLRIKSNYESHLFFRLSTITGLVD